MYRFFVFIAFVLITGLSSCGESGDSTPKPRGFPRVDFPAKKYTDFNEGYCHFTFQKPDYVLIEKDTSFFGEKPANECWFDIYYPQYDSRIYFTYYPINKNNELDKLISDAFRLAREHTIKANYIEEIPFYRSKAVNGMIFDYDGPAATPFQFYITDSTSNFLKASLYFNTKNRPDSLKPIVEFIKKDCMTMIESFKWN